MTESKICREIEIMAGRNIRDAAVSAVEVANAHGCKVFFEFNGTTCAVLPGLSADAVRRAYDEKRETVAR